MSTAFTSHFAERLEGFLKQKRALGYSFNNITDFKLFDRMCVAQFSEETELTSEICNTWAMRRNNETAQTINRRLPFIREFARYLIRNGERACVLPVGTIKGAQRYIPHIYSHDELVELWKAAEAVKPTQQSPAAHIIMPTLLRLLYCCGIRPSEAFKLTMQDVNLQNGKFFIAESKGNRDRIIMLCGDALNRCRKYNETMNEIFPGRTFFFARSITHPCNYSWLSYTFRGLLTTLHIESRYGAPPRLYDFRHHYAITNINNWIDDGFAFSGKLQYLSKSMGHRSIEATRYYYSIVPRLTDTLIEKTEAGFNAIVPEVPNDEEQ